MKQLILGVLFSLIIISPVPVSAAQLTSEQVNAVLGVLESFGVGAEIVEEVRVALVGTSTPEVIEEDEEPVFGAPQVVVPNIYVDITQEEGVVYIAVTGDWDTGYLKTYGVDGAYDPQYTRNGVECREVVEGCGRFYDKQMPPGKYPWTFYATKNGLKYTASGVIEVE